MTRLEVDCLLLSIEELCTDDVKFHKQFSPKEKHLVTQTILDMISEMKYKPLLKPTKCNNK